MNTVTLVTDVCGSIMDRIFERFRDPSRTIEELETPNGFFHDTVRITPTRTGLWLVRMTARQPLPDDPGTLQVVLAEKSARMPWSRSVEDNTLRLLVRADFLCMKGEPSSKFHISCQIYGRHLVLSDPKDMEILDIMQALRGRLESHIQISKRMSVDFPDSGANEEMPAFNRLPKTEKIYRQ